MASYPLLAAGSGFRYSAVQRRLWFGPQLNIRPFQTFFSTASGFGSIRLDQESIRVRVIEGELQIEELVLTRGPQTRTLEWNAPVQPGKPVIKKL